MSRTILLRSANAVNPGLAPLVAQPFGLIIQTCPPGHPVADIVIDLDAMKEQNRNCETVRTAVATMSTACSVAVHIASLGSRRGVLVYQRLDNCVFHNLAWKLSRSRTRRGTRHAGSTVIMCCLERL